MIPDIDKITGKEGIDESDKIRIHVLYELCHLHSSSIRYSNIYRPCYYENTASLIILARLVLPAAKKDAFNKWLDEKLIQGKKLYSSSITYDKYPYKETHSSYYLYSDEFVPLEFFFDKDKTEDLNSVKHILEQANWESNPYLMKRKYEELKMGINIAF